MTAAVSPWIWMLGIVALGLGIGYLWKVRGQLPIIMILIFLYALPRLKEPLSGAAETSPTTASPAALRGSWGRSTSFWASCSWPSGCTATVISHPAAKYRFRLSLEIHTIHVAGYGATFCLKQPDVRAAK